MACWRKGGVRIELLFIWVSVCFAGFRYFIEDLEPGRQPTFQAYFDGVDTRDQQRVMEHYVSIVPMGEIIMAWIDQLIYAPQTAKPFPSCAKDKCASRHPHVASGMFPLPANVSFINCFREACVIAKHM